MRLLILFLFISCAKVSYIAEQGVGQLSLEYGDIDNAEFLNDPNQDEKYKHKVRIIEKAKKYFFKYYGLEESSIYDEVKILDQKAVTYLVIHSEVDKIKAIETSFPIVGSFPYLGFFSKKSAMEFESSKQKEGFHTYMRPVYAYSTLNHPLLPFDDNILSSFFHYNDKALVELVFHELVHTIIFVGDNVGFNENLAQFISEKMIIEYFNYSKEDQSRIIIKKEKFLKLNKKIVSLMEKLRTQYKIKKTGSDRILLDFLKNEFLPTITDLCAQLGIESCWPRKEEWNNARFAALGTYEGKRDELEEIFVKYKLDLKDFVLMLIKKEKQFDENTSFIEFLKKGL
jgi:predicted aminopeptidase